MARAASLRALPHPHSELHRAAMGHASLWWHPPPNRIKINVDALVWNSSITGLGMIARDGDGEVSATTTSFPVQVQSLKIAEALSFRRAMTLAVDLDFRSVSFATDNLQLFQWWRPKGSS